MSKDLRGLTKRFYFKKKIIKTFQLKFLSFLVSLTDDFRLPCSKTVEVEI